MVLRVGTGFAVRSSNCGSGFWLSQVSNVICGRPLSALTVASSDMDFEVRLTTSGAGSMMGVVMARFATSAMRRSRYFIATAKAGYFCTECCGESGIKMWKAVYPIGWRLGFKKSWRNIKNRLFYSTITFE